MRDDVAVDIPGCTGKLHTIYVNANDQAARQNGSAAPYLEHVAQSQQTPGVAIRVSSHRWLAGAWPKTLSGYASL